MSILRVIDECLSFCLRKTLRIAMIVFSWFVVPYSILKAIRCHHQGNMKLPPLRNRLLSIRATKLAAMIRNREVTSEAVILAYISRCKEVNPLLNAIVDERFDLALEEAKQVDRMISDNVKSVQEMEDETPLLGLPITVKESIAVKGLSHQAGRLLKRKHISTEDAPAVAEVKRHGGIVLLVSNTPELCMLWETYNKVTGVTRNPYDLRRTPGGSSGGEAALISSGASLMGLGSDIAGSSRLPAMFTGIFGHKPSPYAVSTDGHVPKASTPNWGQFFTIAPITRYASDLPLLLHSMKDPTQSILSLTPNEAVDGIKCVYMPNDGPSGLTVPVDDEIVQAIVDVAAHFGGTRVQINGLKWALDISMSAMLRMPNVETIYTDQDEHGKPKRTLTKEIFKYFTYRSKSIFPSVAVGLLQAVVKAIPESRHKQLARITVKLQDTFRELLGTNGVFLYPTFPATAHRHYECYHKLVEPSYLMVFNTLGMPVTNCMIRLDRNQLPIGIQVVANPGMDHLTIAVAKEIERHFGGWIPPPVSSKE